MAAPDQAQHLMEGFGGCRDTWSAACGFGTVMMGDDWLLSGVIVLNDWLIDG